MKKIIFAVVCALMAVLAYPRVFSFVYRLVPPKFWTARIAYGQVRDIYNPSNEDYATIQKFLTKGRRPALAKFGDLQKRVKNFCIIGPTEKETPRSGIIAVNCSEDDKENCLLVYASFNKSYPKGLERLVDAVAKSDFKGHILYRIGGWPNVEEGDLKLAHVPYAFKPCFFREAKRLGYKRALWLDTSVMPVVSLNQIFETIKSKGYFAIGNGQFIGPLMNKEAASSLGATLEECAKIPSISSGLFGVDFSKEKANLAVLKWYQAARDVTPFFSPRSDQNVVSILLYQLDMREWAPKTVLAEGSEPLSETTLFTLDRGFVYGK
jgi:hypothetical protein